MPIARQKRPGQKKQSLTNPTPAVSVLLDFLFLSEKEEPVKLVTEMLGGPQAETVKVGFTGPLCRLGAKRPPCRLRQGLYQNREVLKLRQE